MIIRMTTSRRPSSDTTTGCGISSTTPGRDHRHGSRGSWIDGPRLAPKATEGRSNHGRDEREDIRTPARSSGAPPTRRSAGHYYGWPSPCFEARFTLTHERLPDGRDKDGSCERWMLPLTLWRFGA